ncbi:MAG: hypothetical protein H6975_07195 [Gammaproteobacteria bacterium]|nr:hypothetical protein [Gammaproteobacteria bacterium]
MCNFPSAEGRPEKPHDLPNCTTRVPRAAQARLLLHGLEVDPPFMDALHEVLPDETARLAYLNHLAWESRS